MPFCPVLTQRPCLVHGHCPDLGRVSHHTQTALLLREHDSGLCILEERVWLWSLRTCSGGSQFLNSACKPGLGSGPGTVPAASACHTDSMTRHERLCNGKGHLVRRPGGKTTVEVGSSSWLSPHGLPARPSTLQPPQTVGR